MKIFFSVFVAGSVLFLIFSCRPPSIKKFETRAVWMSRFEYAQDKNAQESQDYIRTHFQKFRDAGINIIIFQVRGNADVFYKSKYEPWSQLLTDSLGQDPGWDPLEFALNVAHKLGLDLHAWVNTFPAWRANDPPPSVSIPLHPFLAHPEWVVCDSGGNPMNPEHGYITFSPGIPAVQRHILNVVLDMAKNYDIDGIHFDYIRYPESSLRLGYSHDSVSVHRSISDSDNPGRYDWDSFQREQINHFVETVYNKLDSLKPWLKISAAVIGHHHGTGWNGFHAVFQDAQRWMSIGKIDIIFPMTYQQIGHETAPFEGALDQWKHMMYTRRQIIPAIATYKLGRQYDLDEIRDQIELIRSEKFPGMIFFSSNSLVGILDQVSESYYTLPALISPLPWKKDVPVLKVNSTTLNVRADSLFMNWICDGNPHCFVLYHQLPISDPRHILTIIPGYRRTYEMLKSKTMKEFYITAVNRVGIESMPEAFPQLIIAGMD
jgi:uncharacterized lipoprotein YddW (UPF0748 family)